MLNINYIAFTGRLTRDVEIKNTQSGVMLAKFSVAVSNPRKDKSGNWHNDSAFLDCTAFNHTADRAEGLEKGQQVYIEGRIIQENWEKDGQKRSKLSVTVSTLKPFKTSRRDENDDFEASPAPRPAKDLWGGGDVDDEVPF